MPKTKSGKRFVRSVTNFYRGKKVPMKYRSRYGKVYSSKEAKSVAFAIAKKKGIRL